MITRENLKNLILSLGFKENNNTFIKKYRVFDYEMSVDFDNEVLNYGNKVAVNDKTTSNFSHDENFVVFECVNRLIDMGYRPEDIELEPRWTLGHDAKGGKADVVVYSKDSKNKKKILFIIECKTYGREYDKEYKNTILDGGQLFSYLQQEKSCEWLSLYASDFENDNVIYKTDTIKVFDDNNILKLAEKDETILLYKNASNKEELFEVWDETYEKRFVGDTIFNEDSIAYDIGIRPLKKKDLKDFTENDNIVNKFEEILRHNNVSDKENAFNRLIALFIAKLADEIEKEDDDTVDFQYKVGTDTFETLQDRLQRLHKDGMEKFMNEEIMYIDDNYAEELVKQYTGQRRINMINSLKDTIRKLKFYTNNDFAFKDVHNEELFLQNGKVLLEVVELFENYRIINVSQANAQFLGDMFEQLLNQGFKQNEGQFFTPNQITRFIWESLPLKRIMKSGERLHYPRVIDYACGAGHFITQGVLSIKDFLTREDVNYKDLHPDKYFYGIEKDYRLARVSRVSLYMNDCNEGNIIFGDGLDNYKDKGIDNKKFDILVANPPYSVKEFKSHLKLYNNKLELLDGNYITNQGSEIETCFVERINQLLKPCGIAAVVLPSSLLNKDGQSFSKARENIIYNFKIRAIVELGSKTFGATGTNTVIMFLEKYNEPPKRISLVNDSIEQIFEDNLNSEFEDINIFKEYVKIINVDSKIYKNFINKKLTIDNFTLAETTNQTVGVETTQQTIGANSVRPSYMYFVNIYNELLNTAEYKNKINSKQFQNLSDEEKNKIILDLFYKFAFGIEKEKMTYFALTYNNETLIVSSPIENDAQEKFLGYKWSNRKGQEGIQIIKYGGELYYDREKNPRDSDKIFASDLIREMFEDDKNCELESELLQGKYHKMKTCEMFDFNKVLFSNSINTTKNIKRDYSYEVIEYKLNNKNDFSLQIGNRVLQNEIIENGQYPIYSANVKEEFGRTNKLNLDNFKVPSILWGIDGDFMTNIIDKNIPFYPTDHCGVLRVLTNEILPKYAMYALQREGEFQKFSRTNRASIDRIKALTFYIPNIDKQKEIVSAFDEIDEKISKLLLEENNIIQEIKNNIISLTQGINDFDQLNNLMVEVKNSNNKIPKDKILKQGNVPVVTQEKDDLVNGFINTDNYIEDVPLILFGDHSCCFKYIDFNFVRGADGTQLIKTNDKINLKYLYYYLTTVKIQNSEKYERHFKYLKNEKIPIVSIDKQNEFFVFATKKEEERKNLNAQKEKLLNEKETLIQKYFK